MDIPQDDLTPDQYEEAGPSNRTDFHKLQQAVMNEKLAPDIQHYQGELVKRVAEALEAQENELERLEAVQDADLVHQVLTLELDRLRYLLKSYLRTRLRKVEKYAALCLLEGEVQERLSPEEQQYADGFFRAAGRHMKAAALEKLPDNYQQLTKRYAGDPEASIVVRPDANVFVFARALEDCGQVPDGPDGQTALISKGDQLAIRYASITHLVASRQMVLL